MNPAPRRPHLHPFFLEHDGESLFALEVAPDGPVVGDVLYLPPFAEEMNRLRSHASAAARALAAQGWRCLLLDPSGTGESSGTTESATWERWHADAMAALRWLDTPAGRPTVVWGARAGALLAGEVAAAEPQRVSRLLLWQPVTDGALFLNQTLRLRIASQMVHDGEKETTDLLRRRLAGGETLEVAGYPLSPAMADALASRKLAAPVDTAQAVDWIEIIGKPEQALPPASRRWIDAATASGAVVRTLTAVAPMIWQVHGREDAPALIDATVQALTEVHAAQGGTL